MDTPLEYDTVMQLSIGELRKQARYYHVRVDNRGIKDIVDDVVRARVRARQERAVLRGQMEREEV
jgi:hypothetical protein